MSASSEKLSDKQVKSFLQHLTVERNASPYTLRNYQQALSEFIQWHGQEKQTAPVWRALGRDDFRSFLRFLGRKQRSRAAVMLRFSALRSFYKFLARRGIVENSPIKGIAMPKAARRLPRFLTADQMLTLLRAPVNELQMLEKAGQKVSPAAYHRDAAILETIY